MADTVKPIPSPPPPTPNPASPYPASPNPAAATPSQAPQIPQEPLSAGIRGTGTPQIPPSQPTLAQPQLQQQPQSQSQSQPQLPPPSPTPVPPTMTTPSTQPQPPVIATATTATTPVTIVPPRAPPGAPGRNYLNTHLAPYLRTGMTSVLDARPQYPLRYLGEYLIAQSLLHEGGTDEKGVAERFIYAEHGVPSRGEGPGHLAKAEPVTEEKQEKKTVVANGLGGEREKESEPGKDEGGDTRMSGG